MPCSSPQAISIALPCAGTVPAKTYTLSLHDALPISVLTVRSEATADDSLAAMRARSKFGIAIAAMIRMIATTISSSIRSEEHTSELQTLIHLVCRLLLLDDRLAEPSLVVLANV